MRVPLLLPLVLLACAKSQPPASPPAPPAPAPKLSLDLASCKGAKQLSADDFADLKRRFQADAWLWLAASRAGAIGSCELAVSQDGGDSVFTFADGSVYQAHNHQDTWTRKLYLASGFTGRAQALALLKDDISGAFPWDAPHEEAKEVQGLTHGHGRIAEFRAKDPAQNETLSITFDGDKPIAIEDDGAA